MTGGDVGRGDGRRACPPSAAWLLGRTMGVPVLRARANHAATLPCPQVPHRRVGLSITPPATHTDAPGGGASLCPAPLNRLRPPAKPSAAATVSQDNAGT